jgi:hypothetical protein
LEDGWPFARDYGGDRDGISVAERGAVRGFEEFKEFKEFKERSQEPEFKSEEDVARMGDIGIRETANGRTGDGATRRIEARNVYPAGFRGWDTSLVRRPRDARPR